MNNNDPFKKMDLNFDPTVEAKIEPKPSEENKSETTITNSSLSSNEQVNAFRNEALNNEPKQEPVVESKTVSSFNFNNEDKIDSVIENKEEPIIDSFGNIQQNNTQPNNEDLNRPQNTSSTHSMDKTLEFIIQNDPVQNTDLTVDEKTKAAKEEKQARKHKRISHYWVVICVLSMIFGFTAIWAFAGDIQTIISSIKDHRNDGDTSVWNITVDFFYAFLDSFEALLFVFFIVFSMKKYSQNHKPWVKWWDDTEPIRIANWIKEEKATNVKHLERVNALGLYYTHTNKEANSDHELLTNLKKENKLLHDMISKEENRRKDLAKQKKKS